jgi:3-oxoacyl-[acyl-carrier-protein] synthase-1
MLGYGESSDAYHISTPRPDGAGAVRAMGDALGRAGLTASQIDYVNLHGTATPLNDRLEASALAKVVGSHTPCSSTKGWTGHALGAAGITEAVIACLSIRHQWLPGTLNCLDPEPNLGIDLLQSSRPGLIRRVLSNSFGFGGSNCGLVFGSTAC